MPFALEAFRDLARTLEGKPEWRRELRRSWVTLGGSEAHHGRSGPDTF